MQDRMHVTRASCIRSCPHIYFLPAPLRNDPRAPRRPRPTEGGPAALRFGASLCKSLCCSAFPSHIRTTGHRATVDERIEARAGGANAALAEEISATAATTRAGMCLTPQVTRQADSTRFRGLGGDGFDFRTIKIEGVLMAS